MNAWSGESVAPVSLKRIARILVTNAASTTHAELNEQEQADQGIKTNTIRLSIGTEHIDDIIEDLDEAFKAVAE